MRFHKRFNSPPFWEKTLITYNNRFIFHATIVFIGDFRFKIFQIDEINDLVGNFYERVFNRILILQVNRIRKPTYLHITTILDYARIAIEKRNSP